jgi:sugar phosphate isomerase/epimerase
MMISRRHVLSGLGAAVGLRIADCGLRIDCGLRGLGLTASERDSPGGDAPIGNEIRNPQSAIRNVATSFHLSVLTDEISQDFGHACEVASREFGLGFVDLREAAAKNIMNWDAAQIADARRVMERFDLKVACIASPFFKVDWPGAPKSSFSPSRDEFGASFSFDQQQELLERAFDLAKTFGTDRIRIFDFWRLDDQKPHRAAIDEVVRKAAVKAGARGLTLVLENEYACNTATGAEAARLLAAISEPALQITWDPGNAQWRGETAYPDGYARLPKSRIGHVHCKDASRSADGKGWEWQAMGRGAIDWAGQFAALRKDGYRHACTLETHWRGAGTPEASSRDSFAGMKALIAKSGA